MTKPLVIFIATLSPLFAQQTYQPIPKPVTQPLGATAFQQNGWLRIPPRDLSQSPPMDGQAGPVTGRPLSATEVRTSQQTLSDGSHITNSENEGFYRDSVGRMRSETSTGVVIFDPVAGYVYDLTARNKTYTKSQVTPNTWVTIAAAAHRSSSSSGGLAARKSGVTTEDLTPQAINGIYAKGSRVTSIIPAGTFGNDRDLKVVSERWYSDDLKLLVKSSNSDPRFGVTSYELTNISQTAPDPSLFQVPTDYTEGH